MTEPQTGSAPGQEPVGEAGEDGGGCPTARHIARVASQLFARRGFAATHVRAIVEAAGVTCPTLYYHFKSKEGLAQALLTRPSTAVVEAMRGLLDDASLDPFDRLVRMADTLLDFSREDPDRARFLYSVMFGPADEALAAEADGFARRIAAVLVEASRRAAEAGLVPPDRAADLAKALRGQVVIHAMDFLYRDGALGPGLADRLLSDLLLGLSGSGAGGPEDLRGRRPPGPPPT